MKIKSSDQFLLEQAYASMYNKQFSKAIKKSGIEEAVKYDMQCIEELFSELEFEKLLVESGLLNEWGLKDIGAGIKKGWEGAKGAVKSGFDAVKNSIISGVVKPIISSSAKLIPAQELGQQVKKLVIGTTDRAAMESAVTSVKKGTETVQESFDGETNKQFLARILFSERNLTRAFNQNGLLLEARGTKALEKLSTEIAKRIKEIYPKNKEAMQAAVPKFYDMVGRKLGVTPSAAGIPTAGAEGGAPAAGATAGAEGETGSAAGATAGTEGGAAAAPAAPAAAPETQGFFKKLWTWVKQNPIKSALGLFVIIGLGVMLVQGAILVWTGGLLLGLLKKAGFATLVYTVKEIAGAKIKGEKIPWKKVVKGAVVTFVLALTLGVLFEGLKWFASEIFHWFSGMFGKTAKDPATIPTPPEMAQTAQPEAQPEAQPTTDSGAEDEFKAAHGTTFDPNSSLDQQKKAAADIIKNAGLVTHDTKTGLDVRSAAVGDMVDSWLKNKQFDKANTLLSWIQDHHEEAATRFSFDVRQHPAQLNKVVADILAGKI